MRRPTAPDGRRLALTLFDPVRNMPTMMARTVRSVVFSGLVACLSSCAPAQDSTGLRFAAERGDISAQTELGMMYVEGRGVERDYVEAARWFRLAADQGDPYAQNSLGILSETGLGVPRDDLVALRWYRFSAEQGCADAQHNLGVMYAGGRGVEQDHVEAARWLRLAADQGHAKAQLNLGRRLSEGRGVTEDRGEAAKWFRLAADQGDADAQLGLGMMCFHGEGVPMDYVEAYKWLDLGVAKLSVGFLRNTYVMLRDAIAASMTPAQLAAAQRLVREWEPSTEPVGNFSPCRQALPSS